jgi:hypothetical protein
MQLLLNYLYDLWIIIELNFWIRNAEILNYFTNILDLIPTIKTWFLIYINNQWLYIVELSVSVSAITSKWVFLPASLTLLFQTLFSVILMIWARAAGPRFRLDQIFTMTWKDYFITLSLITIFLILIYFIF